MSTNFPFARRASVCGMLVGLTALSLSVASTGSARAVPSFTPTVFSKQVRIGIVLQAISRTIEYEPIGIATEETFTAGTPLTCTLELTGGPAHVTITSDPPGAVSFSGIVASAHAQVQATTSPSASGRITIHAVTDGSSVVSTHTAARAEVPGGGNPDPH